ncbi:MAG: DEAD/DEAH box helicase [Gammaproteobacteria bacterium]|nr:DEAD/DEAH box helicase [Gammaproteobacteria bacterium]
MSLFKAFSACMPSAAAYSEIYKNLSPAAQSAALVYGVFYPRYVDKARVVEAITYAALRPGKQRMHSGQIMAAVKELGKVGIVSIDSFNRDARLDESWAPWLTLEAHLLGVLNKLRGAFEHEGPAGWNYYRGPDRKAMDLRCLTVLGQFEEIDRHYPDINADDWRFLAGPGAAPLLRSVPTQHLAAALEGSLTQVIETFAQPESIIKACYQLAPDISPYLCDIAFIRILQGRLDEAGSMLDKLEQDTAQPARLRIDACATRAFIATLRGKDDEALSFIEAAIAEEKKITRKRSVFPTARAFSLSLLSLLRSDTPASLTLLKELIGAAAGAQTASYIVRLVSTVAQMKYRPPSFWPHYGKAPFYALFSQLAVCWRGEQHLRDPKSLEQLRRRAHLHGYNWVEAECQEIIATHNKGQSAGKPGDLFIAKHADMGTVSLVSLVQPVPEWEVPLKEMERFAYELKGKRKPAARKAARKSPRRLVWDVDDDKYGNFIVTPREQRANKDGDWYDGGALTPRQLLSKASKMDFLLEQDRAAIATIKQRQSGRRGQKRFYVPIAGLYELAGHPHVYRADDGEPIDVVRTEPELSVDEVDEETIMVNIGPHAEEAVESSYAAHMIGERRCEVTRFSAGHKRLFNIIPPEGLELPAAARERMLEAVAGLTAAVRVQGAISETAETIKQIAADPQPWVKLEPRGSGLHVELVVEPAPHTATYMEPGLGGATVFANRNGETVQAQRDLKAERTAVQELIAACPLLAALGGGQRSIALSEPLDCLELLEQVHTAGARCLWPGAESFKIAARAQPNALKLNVKSAAEWFQASGQLEIDQDRVLGLRDLFALLDKQPDARFLKLEDGEFIALTTSFRRQLDDLRSLSTPAAQGSVRFHAMTAPALQDFLEQTNLDAAGGWHKLCARLRDAQAFEPQLPGTLQAELRPYQLEGFRWLARLSRWGAGACLADDMGLGKTVQALALLLQRAPDGPALVVAPTSVCANWVHEARRFAPTLNVLSYTGLSDARAKALEAAGPFDLVVTTYGLLHIDADALTGVEWHSAVLDEAQAIRNPATKRARAARKLKAGFRLVTTGTPIQNNLTDLYSLFSFINPGLLGSMEQYRRNFALPIEKDVDPDARARLRRLIAPFVLRRLKTEVLDDLPERTEIILHVEMSAEEAAVYEALRQRAVEDLESLPAQQANEGERKLQVLAHLTRLRLACCNPRLVGEVDASGSIPASSKLETFAETLDELLANRHKALVFSQFVKHLKLVEEYLAKAGVSYQYLDGSTPARTREKRIAAFQAGAGDVFLISLKAGGVGLNLTAADYVIHLDPWWNPAAEDQASDRAHRIGQTRPVTIYRLVTQGTIEEQIVDLHHHKRDLADRLLEGADAPARLNAEELLNLLRQPLN